MKIRPRAWLDDIVIVRKGKKNEPKAELAETVKNLENEG